MEAELSLTPIPFLLTSQLGTKEGYLIKQGKIVKVRKPLTPCFYSITTHTIDSEWRAEMARPQFPYREEQFVFYFPKKRCAKFSQGNYHPFLIFQNWKTRWFTLHRNELKYFKDQTVSSEHQFHSSNLCRGSCNLLLPLSSCISITAYQATASHAVRGVRPFSQSFADDLSEQVIKFYS